MPDDQPGVNPVQAANPAPPANPEPGANPAPVVVNLAPPANPVPPANPKLAQWLHGITYILVAGVMVTLVAFGWIFMSSNSISDPKVYIAITLTSLFVLATTTTLAMIFLWGAGVLNFTEKFMNWLGGATVAEVAGILTIIISSYFTNQNSKPTDQTPKPETKQGQTAPNAQPSPPTTAVPNSQPASPSPQPSTKTTPAPNTQAAPQPQ